MSDILTLLGIIAAGVAVGLITAWVENRMDPWLNARQSLEQWPTLVAVPTGPDTVDDGYPVEVDCGSCHGTGINDSLLLVFGGDNDRSCRDCDGSGVRVVWMVDCPACAGEGLVYVGHDGSTGVPMDDVCGMCGGTGCVDAERVA